MPGNDVTDLQLLSAAACVCVFWFLGQFTFDASLDSTDVTARRHRPVSRIDPRFFTHSPPLLI